MLCLQRLLDASLPEDVEEGSGDDSLTYSIGTALDHIGTTDDPVCLVCNAAQPLCT